MKMLSITNGFNKMTDAYLLVRANTIKTDIAANPTVFNSPQPTLTEMGTLIASFQAAVQKAEGGNRQDIAEKNAIREELIDKLHLLGNYVLFTAAGNEVIATLSGFRIGKTPVPLPPITAPDGLQLTDGANKGELKFSFKRVTGARAYMYEITPSPITANSKWESSLNTLTNNVFTGLESSKEYNCRVAAIGNKSQVVYSGVVSRIVQ